MDNRVDLPCLESVEATAKAYAFAAVMVALIAAVFCGGLCGLYAHWFWPGQKADRPELIPAILLTSAVFGLLFVRIAIRCGYRWKTDREGLTERSLSGQRYIQWTDVTRAARTKSLVGETRYTLWAGKKQVVIPSTVVDGPVLMASIWQHLRRFGRSDDSLLSEESESLWISIPESIPQDIDFYNSRVPDWRLALLWLVAIVVGCCGAWVWQPKLVAQHAFSTLSHFVFVLIPHLFGLVRQRMILARSAYIRSGWFEATNAFGKVDLQWSDIRRARATDSGLMISAGGLRRTVLLPYSHGNDEQARVVLAAIRHLRGSGCSMAVALPELMLASPVLQDVASKAQTGPLPEMVEVRSPKKGLIIALAVPAVMFLFVVALWRFIGVPLFILLVTGGLLALMMIGVTFSLRSFIRADAEGITKHSGFSSRLIKWSEVAVYVVKPAHVALGTRRLVFLQRILKNANGRVLMTLSETPGHDKNMAKLIAYVDAKLARVRRDEA